MKKRWMLIACAGLMAALLGSGLLLTRMGDVPVENAGEALHAATEPTALTYQGTEYPIKDHIQTVLFLGTDSMEAYQEEQKLQDYYNFNQADVLMLLVLDLDANRADVIQLNRDTMTDVPWLDVLGNYGGTEYKQICLAYNYGDGGRKSCKNTLDAVSDLLFGAPIQSYIQLPMSAIALLNDLVGGVPVTVEEDLTSLDPSFTQGARVRLKGKQAENFLRARMGLEDDTNLARMRRHRMYMDSFQACAREALDSDSAFAMKLVETLSEYLQSDLTAQQLTDLVERLDAASIAPIGHAEGELVQGNPYYEFYAEEASLWELVKNAYCE